MTKIGEVNLTIRKRLMVSMTEEMVSHWDLTKVVKHCDWLLNNAVLTADDRADLVATKARFGAFMARYDWQPVKPDDEKAD